MSANPTPNRPWLARLLPNRQRLRGRCVVVTGAGGGIGREIALRFAEAGAAHVALWDLSAEALERTANEVRSAAPRTRVSLHVVDLTDRAAVYAAATSVKRELASAEGVAAAAGEGGKTEDNYVSVLVNNAGLGACGRPLLETSDVHIEKLFGVNVLAHFWTAKAFLPEMRSAGFGHIVNIASMQGHIALPGMTGYSASKHAAVGFAESLRRELRQFGFEGVRSSCVCPCHVDTDMFRGFQQPLLPTLSPRQVSEAVVDAVRHSRDMVILPHISGMFAMLNKCLPASVADMVGSLLKVGHGADTLDTSRVEQSLALMVGNSVPTAAPLSKL